MMHTHNTDGLRARTQYTADSSSMKLARFWPKKDMATKLMRPSRRKVRRATVKIRRTWFCLPRVLASETVLLRATGRPAVEMVRKKL